MEQQQAFKLLPSSVQLGSDNIDYKTTNNVLIDNQSKVRQQSTDVSNIKHDLTKHHFKLGNDTVEYKSIFNSTIGKTAEYVNHHG